ncbi:helix-turn-helix domain-containing protein [Lachnospiraceae bacterium MD308]|nr:helix-turn-helix domain-containing protein [Lachnospiraceae bacterium MD308]
MIKKHREPFEFEIIQAAIQGDVDSINQIITYFQPYIKARCKRKFKDEFGQEQYVTDEYMKRRLETKLITKILDFKIQV